MKQWACGQYNKYYAHFVLLFFPHCLTVFFNMSSIFFRGLFFFCLDACQQQACEIMAELVEGLQSVFALGHHRNGAIPAFFTPTLRNIIISLSRLPLVNSYTRVPPLVSHRLLSPYVGGRFRGHW